MAKSHNAGPDDGTTGEDFESLIEELYGTTDEDDEEDKEKE